VAAKLANQLHRKRFSKKIYILSGGLFLLFSVSFFFSSVSPVDLSQINEPILRMFVYIPFLLISLLPGIPAILIGSVLFCYHTNTGGDAVGYCDQTFLHLLYFLFSLGYSLLPLLILKLLNLRNK